MAVAEIRSRIGTAAAGAAAVGAEGATGVAAEVAVETSDAALARVASMTARERRRRVIGIRKSVECPGKR